MKNKLPDIPLWDVWNKKSLIKRCEEIGTRAFERGFRQKAITDEELLFPHFIDCVQKGTPLPLHQFAYTGVDLSSAKRQGNVIITVGVDVNGRKFLLDVTSGAWSSPETAEKIYGVYTRFKPEIVCVENNAYQQALIDWMLKKEYKDVPIDAFTTGKQKSDREIGLPALDVQFERKQWDIYLPDHETGCKCPHCIFEKEFMGYPGYDTSDYVMAFWFAERALAKYYKVNTWCIDKKSPSIGAKIKKMNF